MQEVADNENGREPNEDYNSEEDGGVHAPRSFRAESDTSSMIRASQKKLSQRDS
jgi:hypothetical protein